MMLCLVRCVSGSRLLSPAPSTAASEISIRNAPSYRRELHQAARRCDQTDTEFGQAAGDDSSDLRYQQAWRLHAGPQRFKVDSDLRLG